MFTQVIIPKANPISLEIPDELIGHKVRVTMDDMESNGHARVASVEEILSHFNAIQVDTRGLIFDREEANAR